MPTDALGNPVLSAATVKPEDARHVEFGVKTEFRPGYTANFTVFNTGIKDYQTQVVNAQVGVLRGYLANAEKVRVRGAEFDGNARINQRLSFYGAAAYTDGIYVSFPDAPPPVEDTGGPQVKDISGSVLPGISKWALTFGGEYNNPATIFGQVGEFFGAVDTSYRSEFSSSPSASRYMMVDGYGLVNLRAGYPLERGLVGVPLVAQSARQAVLRVPDGAAGQLRPDCRLARRPAHDRPDRAHESSLEIARRRGRCLRVARVRATMTADVVRR